MPYYLKLAAKNVFRQKKRSLTLGMNYFVVSLLLVLVFSFSEGVSKNFSGNLVSAAAGHLTITGEVVDQGKTYVGIGNYPKVESVLRSVFGDQVQVRARYKLTTAISHNGYSKNLSFQGIDPSTDVALKDQLQFDSGSWTGLESETNGILISRVTAQYLELNQGDELVIAVRTRFGAFNTATVKIAGIYESANFFVQDVVLTRFDFLSRLDLSDGSTATNLFVYFPSGRQDYRSLRDQVLPALEKAGYKVSRPETSTQAISVVASASPQFKIQDASVNEKHLTVATVDEVLSLLAQAQIAVNGLGWFVGAILLFIVAISIFINMKMTINDRIQEIGTLRAMGTEISDILKLLVWENVILSVAFVLAGLVFGLIIIMVFAWGITLPPAGMLSLFLDHGHLVLIPTLPGFASIIVAIPALTAVFSYFPARRGGKIPPAVALGTVY